MIHLLDSAGGNGMGGSLPHQRPNSASDRPCPQDPGWVGAGRRHQATPILQAAPGVSRQGHKPTKGQGLLSAAEWVPSSSPPQEVRAVSVAC